MARGGYGGRHQMRTDRGEEVDKFEGRVLSTISTDSVLSEAKSYWKSQRAGF